MIITGLPVYFHFYPRPPRGGRPYTPQLHGQGIFISIHALREEGDIGQRQGQTPEAISIHALREEGDSPAFNGSNDHIRFLSTPSARRATIVILRMVWHRHDFYPRPPRGGRPGGCCCINDAAPYFYPRPPRGGRPGGGSPCTGSCSNFYPRPPRGGRQQKQRENTLLLSHYTPPCTNCKEMSANQTAKSHRYLRKRLVFRCEASRKTMCAAGSHWPDIKKSARYPVQTPGAVQRARPWSGSCCPAGRTADCPRQGRSGRSALL